MNCATSFAWVVLAQADPAGGAGNVPAAPGAVNDAASVAIISLRRWFGSLTLSSPSSFPSRYGFLAFLAGIGGLLLLAIAAQGPRAAIGQFLNLRGVLRCAGEGTARLKRSGRLVAILLAAMVISWTGWQSPMYNRAEKKEELALVMKSKSRLEFAAEQGSLTALTPFRDLVGLGDTLVLLVGAASLVFKFSADRWGRYESHGDRARSSLSGLTTMCWSGAGLYAMYRLASLIVDSEGLPPLGGCLFVEVGVVPVLMALSDGLLLAWVLVELRGREVGDDEEGFDMPAILTLVPSAVLACVLAMPSRYAATTAALAYFHHLPVKPGETSFVLDFLRGWGLVGLQGGAFLTVGVIGAAAWSPGGWGATMATYGRLLRAHGGRLAALMALAGVAVGAASALAYYAVLALPQQPWVLLAADSYAHYATLPVGLVFLGALVELARSVAKVPEPEMLIEDEPGSNYAPWVANRIDAVRTRREGRDDAP